MQINLTAEQEAFLKAHFATDDLTPVIQEHLDLWIEGMAEAVHPFTPTDVLKKQHLQDVTKKILDKKKE